MTKQQEALALDEQKAGDKVVCKVASEARVRVDLKRAIRMREQRRDVAQALCEDAELRSRVFAALTVSGEAVDQANALIAFKLEEQEAADQLREALNHR